MQTPLVVGLCLNHVQLTAMVILKAGGTLMLKGNRPTYVVSDRTVALTLCKGTVSMMAMKNSSCESLSNGTKSSSGLSDADEAAIAFDISNVDNLPAAGTLESTRVVAARSVDPKLTQTHWMIWNTTYLGLYRDILRPWSMYAVRRFSVRHLAMASTHEVLVYCLGAQRQGVMEYSRSRSVILLMN